ncbi:hypothetical protein H112_03306 [Trichophyton rubrum D6]|uniref:Uncharacterized protein n=3 Tax=Trichophyton TaxID=5550 RepID=F2SS64_TRIRC|nr:uncharacterized protein TERG_05912 [Trichophyton rubrum CBS 118892]EZF24062.1 hypothetical protein H100_03311 [Trichophyton rubrum MR850]EZF43195.1 hypothetical protein H102_03305 [Trichophyton rubrum CBS 100081]EZF53843.1 hypothetical protein H103_03318 [Trichophyton rubrum CBS 288.86]EZF64462.1 hypothetical protein H104_03301 [Trichophyton rubrum CBS 289.86]EZF75034.1 hypothetical protein H105_03323 [Trichophyton soudanense CBS 452.61]EZF85731.1 hypothetical protein H110_03311 [Trichophy
MLSLEDSLASQSTKWSVFWAIEGQSESGECRLWCRLGASMILLRLPSSMEEDLDLYGRADEFDLPTGLIQKAVRRRMHPLG